MTGDEKHRLNCAWTVWEQREQTGKGSYSDKLYSLCTFSTVEEFWGYWNNIPRPSQVLFDGFMKKRFVDRAVESYALFKDGIVPEWEDPQNKKGAEWSVRKELTAQALDECWERLVLGVIGETLDAGDEITGIRVVHKNKKDKKEPGNNYRFEIWLRSTERGPADDIRSKTLDLLNTKAKDIAIPPFTVPQFVYKNH